jgi:hypothetical protein
MPKLATSYKDLPYKFDGILGPHNESNRAGKNFTSNGIWSSSCQIDCLSTVTKCSSNDTMVPIFSGCKDQFYSYGTEARLGCFSADSIMQTQAQIVFDVCQRYNKCNVTYRPRDLLRTMRKAQGANSKGSKIMTAAINHWGKAAFLAMRSNDPSQYEAASAAAVTAVLDQAKAAAKDAIDKGEDPEKAVNAVIDGAAQQFAESVASTAQRVAVKKAAFKAYKDALDAKKQKDAERRAQLYQYANSYYGNTRTVYEYSSRGYVKPSFQMTENERKAGVKFAQTVAKAAEEAEKAEKKKAEELKKKSHRRK